MSNQSQTSVSKVTILGCGYMGTALLDGWLRDESPKFKFSAHVRTPASLERLRKDLGNNADKVELSAGDDKVAQAASDADVVLIGVLPGQLGDFLRTSGLIQKLEGKIIVSMLAGVPISQLQSTLKEASGKDQDWQVARVIPTLGCKFGESVTLLASESAASAPEHIKTVDAVLSTLGGVQHVPERLMDDATAIGAAVHALAITAVDAVTDASVADGVPRPVAAALAAQCLRSAGTLMSSTGNMSPEQVKAGMSTPGGITLNASVKLDEKVRPGIQETVRHAIAYARGMNG